MKDIKELIEYLLAPKVLKKDYDIIVSMKNCLKQEVAGLNALLSDKDKTIYGLSEYVERLKKEPEPINILNYKKEYEKQFPKQNFTYNFDNSNRKKDIKYALRQGDKETIKTWCKKVTRTFNTPEEVIEYVIQYFIKKGRWTYVKEDKDVWSPANISIELMKGDCDDLSILMFNLIYYLFEEKGFAEHQWRLKLFISDVKGEGGHALNIWLGDSGEWYPVESTYGLSSSFRRAWLNTPVRYHDMYEGLRAFTNMDKSHKGSLSALKNMVEDL